MGKAELKKLHKEKSLLNAAYSLFLKNGIRHTSIADITEKAGVAKGTFYLYFKDKYDIRDELVATKSAEVFYNAFKAMAKTPVIDESIEEQILFLLEHGTGQLCANRKLMSFLATNLDWGLLTKPGSRKKGEEELRVVEIWHKLRDRMEERFEKVDIMLFMIMELTCGSCYNASVYGSPAPLEELKPELVRAIRAIMDSFRIDSIS